MKENHPIPPKNAERILKWFVKEDLAEEILGDLEEKFWVVAEKKSPFKAKLNYWFQVANYLRPFAIKHINTPSRINPAMYKHNFLISYRNLLKNKGYSFINIGGLAMGMAVAIMIGLWIFDELTYNQSHDNYERIGKVMRSGTVNGETLTFEYLPYALANELETSYGSNFKHVIKSLPIQENILSIDDKKLSQSGIFIESTAPEMLSLKMKSGSINGLEDKSSILLSQSAANALFGSESPIGKTVKIASSLDVKVTGVYENIAKNSQFHEVNFMAPWDLVATANGWSDQLGFEVNFLNIYVELQPNFTFENTSQTIANSILDNVSSNQEYVSVNPQVSLYPMSRWHLYSEWENGQSVGGRIQFVWFFGIIAVFVLILACINFMNLSTARSEKRAKEVAIRKSLGSFRSQLIGQFLSESVLVSILAFALSMLLVNLALPFFNDISGKEMIVFWGQPWFWLIGIGFSLLTALLAGSYPAFYLSSFSPVSVLRGTLRAGKMASIPRKTMVIIQFTVSIALISGTMIVYQQIQFAKNRPTGYSKAGLLTMQLNSPEIKDKFEVIRNELIQSGAILEMSESSSPLTDIWGSDGGFDWQGKDPGLKTDFGTLMVSSEYGKTIGLEFIDGRDFSANFSSDSTGIVINETVAQIMGFENPIGELVSWNSGWHKGGDFKILGVVKDMVMQSPFDPAKPTVFFLGGEEFMNWAFIKIHPKVGISEALTTIEETLKNIAPSSPFDYKFVDETYAAKFQAEERIGKVAGIFSILAILISCLGLFGLASFVAEQRTKEIGIRKIMGASVLNLWKMLCSDFVVLVVISCLIATPIAWYFLDGWLNNYDYRVDISWWVFLASGLGALLITLLTVSFQAIKAATSNPIESLRSE